MATTNSNAIHTVRNIAPIGGAQQLCYDELPASETLNTGLTAGDKHRLLSVPNGARVRFLDFAFDGFDGHATAKAADFDLIKEDDNGDTVLLDGGALFQQATPAPLALTDRLADVSTAGQIYVACPYAGQVTKVTSVLNGAITGADADLTVKDNAGSSMGTITIANSGSAAGDVDTLSPSSNNDVVPGDLIEIETDGASTNAVSVGLMIEITPVGGGSAMRVMLTNGQIEAKNDLVGYLSLKCVTAPATAVSAAALKFGALWQ